LDIGNSDVRWISPGKVQAVRRYSFLPSIIGGSAAFRIPELGSQIFLTNRFVDQVNRSSLVGIAFGEIWDEAKL
jgi:hypothetical protein